MVTAVVIAAVAVALVVGSLVTTVSWAMNACILVEVHFGFFGIGVLVGGHNHLANPYWRLAVELGAEIVMMESSNEGSDSLRFHDVGNRIPHLGKASDVAMEELEWLLVDAI